MAPPAPPTRANGRLPSTPCACKPLTTSGVAHDPDLIILQDDILRSRIALLMILLVSRSSASYCLLLLFLCRKAT